MNRFHSRLAARLLLSASALLAALPAYSQTPFTTGNVEVRAFLARGVNDLYAASHGGGLYRSTDNPAGVNWNRIALPGNDRYLTALAGNTSSTMVVGAEEGLFTSTDGISFTKRLHEPVTSVAMGPAASTTVLAAVRGVGILRSTDSGVSFAPADNGDFTGTDITAVAEDPSNPLVFYAAARPDNAAGRGGVYKSVDGGQNWAPTSLLPNQAQRPEVFGIAVDTSGNVYAAVQQVDGGGGIYRLAGGAGAWALQANTFRSVSVHRDANTTTTIWDGQRGLGLRRKAAADGQFFDQFPGNGANPSFFYTDINAVATLPGNANVALKAVRGAGVYRATNVPASAASGNTIAWTRVNFPGADRVLSATGVAGNANTMVLGLHSGGVWRSDTAGNAAGTFNPPVVNGLVRADFSFNTGTTAVRPFASVWDLSASATNPNLIYAAVGNVGMHYGGDLPGVFRWDGAKWNGIAGSVTGAPNSGAPWNIVQEPGTLPFGAFLPVAVYGATLLNGDDNVVFASFLTGGTGIIRRVSGPTWADIPNAAGNVTPANRAVVPGSVAGGNQRVIALPMDDKPLYSTNFGATFTRANVFQGGFQRLHFYAVAENPNNPNNWVGAANKGVYVSNDSGQSWTRQAAGFALQAFTAVGFKPNGRAFIADWAGNRYCSADGGASWNTLAGGALRAGVNAIRVMNGQLYYLTDGAGVFREDLSC